MKNSNARLALRFTAFTAVAAVLGWAIYSGAVYEATSGSSVGLLVTMLLVGIGSTAVILAAATLLVALRRPHGRIETVPWERKQR